MTSSFKILQVTDRLPWRIAKIIQRFYPPTQGYYCAALSTNPPIVLVPEDFYDSAEVWHPFFDALAHKKVYFLCWVSWNIDGQAPGYQEWFPRIMSEHQARYPKHEFVYLANNLEQCRIFEEMGFRAVFVNHNALVDERVFTVLDGCPKKYDAIYNAALAPYKQHTLAAEISNLALITYFKGEHTAYCDAVAATLKHAAWLNFATGKLDRDSYKPIPKADVHQFLNQAKVGLCLSDSEGAMFASMEYLLSGLPVVSVPSFGGRDVFFDPEYVQIVEPTPQAVNDGVVALIKRQIPPEHVRKKTLEKMAEHRARLITLILELSASAGFQLSPDQVSRRVFSEDILQMRELHRLAAAL